MSAERAPDRRCILIAMRVHSFGGPEVLQRDEVAIPEPGPGEARVRYEAIGVNFHDCYMRSGLYDAPLPHVPGIEAAGAVDAIGPGVTEVKLGARVGLVLAGSTYAEYGLADASRLIPLPEGISYEVAATALLQGLTGHYLTSSTFVLRSGHRALIHAAAGGVGLILVQIAKRIGATVYGTVGSQAKAETILAAGADHAIVYTESDFVEEVQKLTGGSGVDVVYDSVGRTTLSGSLRCLAVRGCLVSFGQSSGAAEPVPPLDLMPRSLYLTRPHLRDYTSTHEELARRAADLFAWVLERKVTLRTDSRYRLAEAAEAHRRLESRRSSGKILLLP